MKKTLTEIFAEATAQELDRVLDGLEFEAPDADTLKRIHAAVRAKSRPSVPVKRRWRAAAAAAACFGLLIAAAGGTYAYAAEVREYNDAVEFFQEYALSTEGLSRGEIKAVYRDIATESFTYSRTAEVIANSLSSSQAAGFEIPQDDPTPEDVENLWNYKNLHGLSSAADPVWTKEYQIRIEYKPDPGSGLDVYDKSVFEKYKDGELVWSVSFTDFAIEGCSPVSDGVFVYGSTPAWDSRQPDYAWMSRIDADGNILWTRRLDHAFQRESIAAILENGDGTCAVFSRGELTQFCLSQWDRHGNQISFRQTEVGNYGIWNAARLGDGYLVQLGSYAANEQAKLIKVDADGGVTDSFAYTAEDQYYYITDMIEFGGSIYLSAYAVPKESDEQLYSGGHYELSSVLNELLESGRCSISSEELTPLVRANYTAVLLVCDPQEGTPREFYSVKGSLGGKLALDEQGTLLWDVESITTTYFSPLTSAFSIGGASCVFRYTFDPNGTLIRQEKTGETAAFYR